MSEDELTPEQAKKMLAVENGHVHTFLNGSFGLIGADHTLASINADIDNAHKLVRTGSFAQKMKHGLAILPHENCSQSDIIFVATLPEEILND